MSKKIAIKIMFGLLGAVLIYHFLIFFEFIPYDKVWAGRLKSVEEMKTFETFSILVNVFMITVMIIKYQNLQNQNPNRIIDILIWVFALFFSLNTFGNLFSQNILELIFGTLFTLIAAILCVLIAKKKK
ncbi:hypothetical protein [Cyclobacterium sp. 1_MG-2023]|uniref:hypothetical protein n=1 Tax=Cyclobacterium sp. 1_MG-2023 TaxID=3062681 RepID=UPI0026E2F0AF|nr:hypothetical protein [Cyclobacterium sp. 1_MG-2023]MDO6439563.1 hypothetical protein [Cyclobacterium sp. 1_MG-2023]|tara:strand:+ start:749 stop:1135 length:387 start_codon:yes stop_codon:yes gene_type:complete